MRTEGLCRCPAEHDLGPLDVLVARRVGHEDVAVVDVRRISGAARDTSIVTESLREQPLAGGVLELPLEGVNIDRPGRGTRPNRAKRPPTSTKGNQRSGLHPEVGPLRHENSLACLRKEMLLNIGSGVFRQVLADLGYDFPLYVSVKRRAQIRQSTGRCHDDNRLDLFCTNQLFQCGRYLVSEAMLFYFVPVGAATLLRRSVAARLKTRPGRSVPCS